MDKWLMDRERVGDQKHTVPHERTNNLLFKSKEDKDKDEEKWVEEAREQLVG
eukprot:c12160_g1_i1 orf=196-351(+)